MHCMVSVFFKTEAYTFFCECGGFSKSYFVAEEPFATIFKLTPLQVQRSAHTKDVKWTDFAPYRMSSWQIPLSRVTAILTTDKASNNGFPLVHACRQ